MTFQCTDWAACLLLRTTISARRLQQAIFTAYCKRFSPIVYAISAHNPNGLGADLIRIARQKGVFVAVTLHDYWGFCFKSTLLLDNGDVCRNFEECHACLPEIATSRGKLPIRFRRDYVAWSLDHADVLVSPSRALAAAYGEAGFGRNEIRVLSNGIEQRGIPHRIRKGGAAGTISLCVVSRQA